MGQFNRKEISQRFKLGQHRYELGVDKNGNPWVYEFGRPIPPYGNPDREHMMHVPETAQITNVRTYHGNGCGSCVHFGDCSKPTVKNAKADQKYCAYPSRGYTGMGASVLVGQGALPPRDPWRDR